MDANSLLQHGAEPPKALDLLEETKLIPLLDEHNGDALVRKVYSIPGFNDRLKFLDSLTSLDPACVPMEDHNLTTKEVLAECGDLGSFSMHYIKHVIMPRLRISRLKMILKRKQKRRLKHLPPL